MGGLQTSNGMKLSYHRLLRAGEVVGLPYEDIKELKECYNLKTIVDFRSQSEVERVPDDVIEGVEYKNIYLHEMRNQKAVPPGQKEFRKLRERQQVIDFMTNVYDRLIKTPFTLSAYRDFIQVVRDNEEGSILFHCYAGKDRTGVAAAIIYSILGMSKDVILEEFLLTNELRKEVNERIIAKVRQEDPDEEYLDALKVSYEVDPSYLEHVFSEAERISGSMIEYIKENIGISDNDIQEIRTNYLE